MLSTCRTAALWPRAVLSLSRNAHAGRAAAAPPTRSIQVSHILVKEDEAIKLDEAEEALKGGKPFAEVAAQFSRCSSAKRGGQLGWLQPGDFFPEFEATAFATPVGCVARARSPRGLHLLRVEEERMRRDVQQVPAHEVLQLLTDPDQVCEVQLVDVREPWEAELASLPGFRLLPLSRFQEWSGSLQEVLDPHKRTLVLCHHGIRSMNMATYLVQQAGFTDVCNITGGIDAVADTDPSVPRY
ncbi:parvulin-type peptidyl-prolyl cis-trans isomerase [Haematococcus lacustris]